MIRKQIILLAIVLLLIPFRMRGQSLVLFDTIFKAEYPSVVYDFLERYLYETDSLVRAGEPIMQRLLDDKVAFLHGDPQVARSITPTTPFSITETDDKYYQVVWTDSTGGPILALAFPMQYELLLGSPKVQLEQQMQQLLATCDTQFTSHSSYPDSLMLDSSNVWMTMPTSHYYIKSLNTAKYYYRGNDSVMIPIFDTTDRWHSVSNLFQGVIDSVDDYLLYVEQNVYGFKQLHYSVRLSQWLSYCQAMKLEVYFAIEEERQDGFKALLIAHSRELGFNHMLSLIIPDDFVVKRNSVIKATMNAYIPTQNVKDLYQQYKATHKKKI